VSNKTGPTPEALRRHRDAQALAYRCAETVGAGLEAGVTEREAARRMRAFLRENGVEDFFHIPFAWFGERTAFRSLKGPWTPLHFFATNRRLEEGMAYILDCSPVVDGYVSDIGYAGVLGADPGANRVFDALMRAWNGSRPGTPCPRSTRRSTRSSRSRGTSRGTRSTPAASSATRSAA
jgi:hypothetical protein